MRAHHWVAVGSCLAGLLTLGSAEAQEVRSSTGLVSGAAAAEAEVGTVQARAAVTPAEQVTQADAITRRAGQLAQRLSKLLDEARREKDIMRANCINRKLTEVNANTRNIEQRSRALKDAAAAGDDARRGHEFTVLSVLSQKLDQLDEEATQCLGQSIYEPGASQVVTTIPGVTSAFADPSTIAPEPPSPFSVSVPPAMTDASPAAPAM